MRAGGFAFTNCSFLGSTALLSPSRLHMDQSPWPEACRHTCRPLLCRHSLLHRSLSFLPHPSHLPLKPPIRSETAPQCPRSHLAWISQNFSEVNGVELDVYPSSGDETDPRVRKSASFLDFGKSRYVVVSDGWVRACCAPSVGCGTQNTGVRHPLESTFQRQQPWTLRRW